MTKRKSSDRDKTSVGREEQDLVVVAIIKSPLSDSTMGPEQAHIRIGGKVLEKSVPSCTVARDFSDAAVSAVQGAKFAQAMIVGAHAQAIIGKSIDYLSGAYVDRAVTPGQKLRIKVGLIAALMDHLASELQTKAGLQTLFIVQGEDNTSPSPPYWLIYALRRFNWPGEVFLESAFDPLARLSAPSINPRQRPLLLRPVLGVFSGAIDYRESKSVNVLAAYNSNQDQFLGVSVDLFLGTSSEVRIAPARTMLPMEHRTQFFDANTPPSSSEGALHLNIFSAVSYRGKGQAAIMVKRGEAPDDNFGKVGQILNRNAPIGEDYTYNIRVLIDEWGRTFVEVFDMLQRPILIRPFEPEANETERLPVLSLLFPNPPETEQLPSLMRAKPAGEVLTRANSSQVDGITLLDQTSFNGKPLRVSAAEPFMDYKPINTDQLWLQEKWLFEDLCGKNAQKWARTLFRMELAHDALNSAIDLEIPPNQPFGGHLRPAQVESGEAGSDPWGRLDADGRTVLFERDGSKRGGASGEEPVAKHRGVSMADRYFSALRGFAPRSIPHLYRELDKMASARSNNEREPDER